MKPCVIVALLLCCSPCWATDLLTTEAPLPVYITVRPLLPSPANAIVSDSFTDTDGTVATAHNPSPIGDGYTLHPPNDFWSTVSPVIDNSNRLRSNDGTDSLLITKETMPTADYEVSADFVVVTNIGNLRQAICLRVDSLVDTGYCAFWNNDGNLYLHRRVAGTAANLQTTALAISGTHSVKLAAIGTSLTITLDGTPLATVVDANISSAGRAGIWTKEATTNTTGVRVDNFLVTNTGVTAVTIVSQTPPVQGTVSAAYSRTLASAGGTGSHAWSLDSGTLPTGLSIGTDGTLSGTPSAAGLYVFTLKVTDGVAATATKTFRMGVNGSAVWYVPAGTTLQPFLTAAVRGDTIHVDNTGTYSESLTLAARSGSCTSSPSTWIDVRSSALASLPSVITTSSFTASAANMPTIKTVDNSGGTGALIASSTACGWKFSGFQITNDTAITINEMLTLSSADRITLDRVAIYAKDTFTVRTPPYNTTGRIAIQSAGPNFSITNSYMPGWWGLPPGTTAGATAHDSTCLTYEGVGPVNWSRNYCEAWFNGIQMGGAEQAATNPATVSASPTPTLTTATLSHVSGLAIGMPLYIDITPWSAAYCKNDNTKPCRGNGIITNIVGNAITYTALIGYDNSGGGSRVTIPGTAAPLVGGGAGWTGPVISNFDGLQSTFWHPTEFSIWQQAIPPNNTPKSWIEIKQCSNCRFEGNLYGGFKSTIGFNGHNQAGGQPWSTIANVSIKDSWFKEHKAGIFMSLTDAYYYTTIGANITIENILFTSPDDGGVATGTIPVLFQSGKGGASGISFRHVTQYLATGSQNIGPWQKTGTEYSPTAPVGTVFKDSLVPFGDLGVNCFDGALSQCWPSLDEDQNLFILNNPTPTANPATQFPNSSTLPNWGAALLVGTCDKDHPAANCGLQAGSPGHNTASDGADIGANITTLLNNCPDCVNGSQAAGPVVVTGGKVSAGGAIRVGP